MHYTKEQIHDAIVKDLTLTPKRLALQFGENPRWFPDKFEELFGTTPYRYIMSLRAAQIPILLRVEPPLTLPQIAKQLGYKVKETVIELFRDFYGTTPGQWRKQQGLHHPNSYRERKRKHAA